MSESYITFVFYLSDLFHLAKYPQEGPNGRISFFLMTE